MNQQTLNNLSVFVPLILFFVILWFFLIRPQRKKDQETKRMRDSLAVGDNIITIGGIVGTVMKVKEESVIVYVGSDKTKMEFMKWAIAQVVNKSDKAAKETAKQTSDKESVEGSKIKRLKKKEDSADPVSE